jgi:hypothetical protein
VAEQEEAHNNLVEKTMEFKAKDFEVQRAKGDYKIVSGKDLPDSDGE